MGIGGGIFLIAVGAIMRFAIYSDEVTSEDGTDGIDLAMVGNILMLAGLAVTLISLFLYFSRRRTVVAEPVVRETPVVRERYVEPPRDPRV